MTRDKLDLADKFLGTLCFEGDATGDTDEGLDQSERRRASQWSGGEAVYTTLVVGEVSTSQVVLFVYRILGIK